MNKSLWHLLVTKKHPMPPSTKFVSTWTDIYIYIYIMVAKQDINAWFLEAWWHWRVIDSDPVGMNNREATVMTTGLLPGKVTYSRKKKKCLEDYLPFEMVPFQLTREFSGGKFWWYLYIHIYDICLFLSDKYVRGLLITNSLLNTCICYYVHWFIRWLWFLSCRGFKS